MEVEIIFLAFLLGIICLLFGRSVREPFTERIPISAGVLTYFAPKTLKHTLETYKKAGFLDSIEDFFVVIQKSERQLQEKEVCDSFGIRSVLLPTNGRMASGFRAIYENARTDVILPLENDFVIHGTQEEVTSFLTNALYFLERYDVVRGRSRKNAGVPNYAADFWSKESPHTFMHHTHLCECSHWEEDPDLVYPSKIQRVPPKHGSGESNAWYTTDSSSCNYTNNPFLCKKGFFEQAILPHLVDGENIEDRLTAIWAKKRYTCVFGPGLFTHDRSYDGHS